MQFNLGSLFKRSIHLIVHPHSASFSLYILRWIRLETTIRVRFSTLSVIVVCFTCWSTPTASSPSYIMLTQPSLHDRTNKDIRAWTKSQVNKVNKQSNKEFCSIWKIFTWWRTKTKSRKTHIIVPINILFVVVNSFCTEDCIIVSGSVCTWTRLSKLYFLRIQR